MLGGGAWTAGPGEDEDAEGLWEGKGARTEGLGGVWAAARGPGAGANVPKRHPRTRSWLLPVQPASRAHPLVVAVPVSW